MKFTPSFSSEDPLLNAARTILEGVNPELEEAMTPDEKEKNRKIVSKAKSDARIQAARDVSLANQKKRNALTGTPIKMMRTEAASPQTPPELTSKAAKMGFNPGSIEKIFEFSFKNMNGDAERARRNVDAFIIGLRAMYLTPKEIKAIAKAGFDA